MKIGILQTGHSPDEMRPDIGDYSDLFEKFLQGNGFTFAVYNVVDMMFPGSVHDCEGWLITGSKHGAYEEHAFIPPLEKLIRDIYAADLPLVGVCFPSCSLFLFQSILLPPRFTQLQIVHILRKEHFGESV